MEDSRLARRLVVLGAIAATGVVALTGCVGNAGSDSTSGAAVNAAAKASVSKPSTATNVSAFSGQTGGQKVGARVVPSSCSLTAVPDPGHRPSSVSEGFPPGEAPAAGFTAISQAAAVSAAHDAAAKYTGAPAPATSPTVAKKESYAAYVTASGRHDNDPRIAPTRCVWVVAVESPITIPHPPAADGSTQTGPLSHYSVVFDAATGFAIEFTAKP